MKLASLAQVLLAVVAACASPGAEGPYRPNDEAHRDTALAASLSKQAAEVAPDSLEEAEELLRRALTADVFHGPAHNNLGIVYLNQGKLYEAANEFEWARKLMPGHPDPRLNLALTLERAGQYGEAEEAFHAAIQVRPGHLPSIQGLARSAVRAGQRANESEELDGWLAEIGQRSESPAWREWAAGQLVK